MAEKTEGKILKRCPFLGQWCKVEECAIAVEVSRVILGVPKVAQICPFQAMVIMLGEINQKTAMPQQKIQRLQLPGLG